MTRYHCGLVGCPGHFLESESCVKPTIPIIDFGEKPPIIPTIHRHKCSSPNCPGHFNKNDSCFKGKLNNIPISLPYVSPEIKVKVHTIQVYYCGKEGCPGHRYETCPTYPLIENL